MTELVGDVRRMLDEAAAKRSCSRLLLGVRALSAISECFGAGLDIAAWMRRGYLDYVVVCRDLGLCIELHPDRDDLMQRGTPVQFIMSS